jgi:putative transposase
VGGRADPGELLTLGRRGAKRTIQTDRPAQRTPRPRGQAWATFLRNHAGEIWAGACRPVTDLLFRPLCAFFVVELVFSDT